MKNEMVNFDIIGINEIDFYLRDIPKHLHSNIDPKNLNYFIDLSFSIEKEKNSIVAFLSISARYDDEKWLREIWPQFTNSPKEHVDLLMHSTIQLIFSVNPIDMLLVDGDNDIKSYILSLVPEICISTVRGIVFTKTQGTALSLKPIPWKKAELNNKYSEA